MIAAAIAGARNAVIMATPVPSNRNIHCIAMQPGKQERDWPSPGCRPCPPRRNCMRQSRSDHEEAVRRVAPELLDQPVFPVEIGLHRFAVDIGALIGPAVAMRRI